MSLLRLLFCLPLLCALDVSGAQITVLKGERALLYQGEGKARRFRIALGLAPVGTKLRQGDLKTPEGSYFITHKNPRSKFYLSLGISYPNRQDAERGRAAGLLTPAQYGAIVDAARERRLPPQHTRMGGEIFIHGSGSKQDWTWGCVALDDADMAILYALVKPGDTVTILK